MSRAVRLLRVVVALACFGCGGRVSSDPDTLRSGDAAPSVTLTIPLGTYTSCSSSQLTVAPKFEGVAGGQGTITLTRSGDGVVANLAFGQFASGQLAFTPTSTTTAAFAASEPNDVELFAFDDPLPTGSKQSLTPAAASLARSSSRADRRRVSALRPPRPTQS